MIAKLSRIRVSDSKITMDGSVSNKLQVFDAMSVMEYTVTWPKGG